MGTNCIRSIAFLALLWSAAITPAKTLTWHNVGPGGGGIILSTVMDPQEFNTIHVGTDLGGYYKSTDGGETFRIMNTGLTDYYVARILVDPTDNDVIYLGTLSGVFKSSDGGMSWVLRRNGFPRLQQDSHSASISALVMDPIDNQTIYAGIGVTREVSGGCGCIYKTVDGAESWLLLHGLAQKAPDAVICQLAIRNDDPTVIFAATDRGIFRSDNSGKWWEPSNTRLPHLFCRDLAIHPLEPDVMYAVMWSTPGQKPWRGGVYRSDDGGQTWIERNEGLLQYVGALGASPKETTNYSRLALDPRDSEHLYVGSDSWWGAGLYESIDGGRMWAICAPRYEDPDYEMSEGWINFWGAAIHCLSISLLQPNAIVFGDSGRLMRTDDGGMHWQQIYTRALPQDLWQGNGMEVTCLNEIAIDPFKPSKIYCGYADIGLMITDDEGRSWRRSDSGLSMSGDIARVVCDPQQESIAWCCEGKPNAVQGGVFMTRDGGITWEAIGSDMNGFPNGPAGLLTLDVDSPLDSRTLYVVSYGNGIYKSSNGGRTWDILSNGFSGQHNNISDLVLEPRQRRLFAAKNWTEYTQMGGLYIMDEGDERWRKINRNMEFPNIKSIAIDPRDPQVMFVACHEYYDTSREQTFSGGVFRSDDGGSTWQQVLVDREATCVRINPFDSDMIYVGSTRYPYRDNTIGRGIVISYNGGNSWVEANEGLTNKNVIAITLDPHDPTRVFVGTGGNGLFIGHWEE